MGSRLDNLGFNFLVPYIMSSPVEAVKKWGTGSEPLSCFREFSRVREVPVPIFSQPRSDGRWHRFHDERHYERHYEGLTQGLQDEVTRPGRKINLGLSTSSNRMGSSISSSLIGNKRNRSRVGERLFSF